MQTQKQRHTHAHSHDSLSSKADAHSHSHDTASQCNEHHGGPDHGHAHSDHHDHDHGHAHSDHHGHAHSDHHGHAHSDHHGHDHGHAHAHGGSQQGWMDMFRAWGQITARSFKLLWRDREARPFLLYNLLRALTVVWVTFSLSWANSLAMKACVYWLYFELFSNVIALCSVLIAKQKTSTHAYSYGLDRLEILLGFSNASFELFAVLFIGFEILEHAFLDTHHGESKPSTTSSHSEDDDGHLDGPLVFKLALVCMLVNLIGPLVFFGRYITRRSEHVRRRQRSVRRQLRQLLIENVPCLLALAVGALVQLSPSGSLVFDLGGAALVSVYGAYISYPLAIQTGSVLLCTMPFSVEAALKRSLREACTVDGVLECLDKHFWTFSPGCFVGTIKLRVHPDADETKLLGQIQGLFSHLVDHLTIQFEKDSPTHLVQSVM
mmetsp:Transcript_23952/g.59925  ORF Transcript_23952/g.59925 Transcript_23952/m.59925 type:complete len:435 (+) Transcript_23952:117-1421(+)